MPRPRGPREDETCRAFVVPALTAAGWTEAQIVEQRYFTHGRIVPSARGHRRLEGKRTDYLLEIRPGFPLAVVEAKRLFKLPGDGLQQAMRYAEILGLGFAYSSNGEGIVEHDFDTGRQTDLLAFPSPGDLWRRYRAWRGITDDVARDVALPFSRDLPEVAFARNYIPCIVSCGGSAEALDRASPESRALGGRTSWVLHGRAGARERLLLSGTAIPRRTRHMVQGGPRHLPSARVAGERA